MKRLSLIDLHKSEIRKSSMAYISVYVSQLRGAEVFACVPLPRQQLPYSINNIDKRIIGYGRKVYVLLPA